MLCEPRKRNSKVSLIGIVILLNKALKNVSFCQSFKSSRFVIKSSAMDAANLQKFTYTMVSKSYVHQLFKKKLRTEFLKQLLKQIINQNPVKLPWFLITFTRRFPYDKYKLRTTSGVMLFHASITFSSKFSQLTI